MHRQSKNIGLTALALICLLSISQLAFQGLTVTHGTRHRDEAIFAGTHVNGTAQILAAFMEQAKNIELIVQHLGISNASMAGRQQQEQQQQQQQQSGPSTWRVEGGAVEFAVPPETGLPSDTWRPFKLTKCLPGMPAAYAPCLMKKYPNLVAAEEVLYPDFRIRVPRYLNNDHKSKLSKWSGQTPRGNTVGDYAYFLNQRGRNFVFANTSYTGNPPASWALEGCMVERIPSAHRQFSPGVAMDASAHDSLVFAATADSGHFQHWRDRAALMVVQALELRKPGTKFIASPPVDKTVVEQWQLLVNATSVVAPTHLKARHFVYPCDTPLIHPYLIQRVSEMMKQSAGVDPRGRPREERKVVLALLRKDSSVRNRDGRNWLNYEECKPKIEGLLQRRGQGEVLEEWNLSRFPTVASVIKYWNHKVRAVFGVHGSALMNVHWASPNTTVLEIWPTSPDGQSTRGLPVFWEHSAIMGLEYWSFYAQSVANGVWDVNVKCDELVEALSKGLDSTSAGVLELA